jgi:hypothetical protein
VLVIWTVKFNELCGAAVVRTRGVFNVSDHGRMVADIVGRDEWRPGQPILFDHRELSFDGSGYDDMVRARENHIAHESRIGNARSAILMKSTADYGVGRQFQMLADGRVAAELEIFADEPSAKEWLCEPFREHSATSPDEQ